MKIDFHVHTKYSIDSLSDPAKVARICERAGVIPAIADHNNIRAHAELRSIGAKFIPAEEISTSHGDLIALFISEPIAKKTHFLDAIDQIKAQGGLAYLPHMFDTSRSGIGRNKMALRADIIETFNGRSIWNNANRLADEFAEENKKPKAAGSDAHFTFELGKTFTEIEDCELEPKPLLKALKKSKLHCHYSPFYLKGITYAAVAYKKLFRKV
ncbi:MAG: PHP domain-containing protein [Candidatus Micrarchaeia archaeon]|jgi:hypothetical protein